MKDASRARQTTIRMAILLSGVITVVFLISFVFSKGGIQELQAARTRVQQLESEIIQLQSENRRLATEIDSLRKSTFAVERIAREDLGMSKPGETIYMVEGEAKKPQPPKPERRQPAGGN